jgi:hypothetical protein
MEITKADLLLKVTSSGMKVDVLFLATLMLNTVTH